MMELIPIFAILIPFFLTAWAIISLIEIHKKLNAIKKEIKKVTTLKISCSGSNKHVKQSEGENMDE